MKLALYGGSFDPPHYGHVAVVTEALKVLDVDRLIVVPTSCNPFKPSVHASGEVRFQWLQHIFGPFEKVIISDFESARKESVYTIETVLHFAPFYDKIYLIIGADNLEQLRSWHRFEELDSMVTWVVATRHEIPISSGMIVLNVDAPIRSTDFRHSEISLGLESDIEHQILTYYKEHP